MKLASFQCLSEGSMQARFVRVEPLCRSLKEPLSNCKLCNSAAFFLWLLGYHNHCSLRADVLLAMGMGWMEGFFCNLLCWLVAAEQWGSEGLRKPIATA